jgi:hypothetical protein
MSMDRAPRLEQRGITGGAPAAASPVVAGALHPLLALQRAAGNAAVGALLGGGRPLPASLRAEAEARFGHDFGGVRLHTDARAAEAAGALGARAFVAGADMVFGEGQFSPGTSEGRRLLAHELTHVVQQRRGGPESGQDASLEREADAVGARAAAGFSVVGAVSGRAGPGTIGAATIQLAPAAPAAVVDVDADLEKKLGQSENKALAGLVKSLSPRQKELLRGFFLDRKLPGDFFDKDSASNLTVSQRLVLAAHMVSRQTGAAANSPPSGKDGRSLLQQIHNYAGLTPREYKVPPGGTPGKEDGLLAGKDPLGYTHFGVTEQTQRANPVQWTTWYKNTEIGDWLVVSLGDQPSESVMFAGWKASADVSEKATAAVYRAGPGGLVKADYLLAGKRLKAREQDLHIIRAIYRVGKPSDAPATVIPFDPDLGPLSAVSTQESATREGVDRRALILSNVAKATGLLDGLALAKPEAQRYRALLQQNIAPADENVSESELQQVAAVHRGLVLKIAMTNMAKIKDGSLDPQKLAASLKAEATALFGRHRFRPSDRQMIENAIDSNSPVEGVTIDNLTKLVAIIQKLSGDPVTGILDDRVIKGATVKGDAANVADFDKTERRRIFVRAFAAEFGHTLGRDANEKTAAGFLGKDANEKTGFSDRQREDLMSFFITRSIPEELFTGENEKRRLSLDPRKDIGLRALISAHVLTMGKTRRRKTGTNEMIEGKPTADNCGHWVNQVWAYAGVNPRDKSAAASEPGNKKGAPASNNLVGPTAKISFGMDAVKSEGLGPDDNRMLYGRHEAKWREHGDAVRAINGDHASDFNRYHFEHCFPVGRGAIDWEECRQLAELQGTPPPKRAPYPPEPPKRRRPLATLPDVEPGDWLVVYNGNASGHHSVMFAGWYDEKAPMPVGPGAKRRAKVFHQLTNEKAFGERGGGGYFDDSYWLGFPTESDPTTPFAVVYWARSTSATPARTRKDLFPSGPALPGASPAERKEQEKRLGATLAFVTRNKIDPRKLWRVLSARANQLIHRPARDRTISAPQKEVLLGIWQEGQFNRALSPTVQQLAMLIGIIQKVTIEEATGVLDDTFRHDLFEGILEDSRGDLDKRSPKPTLGKEWDITLSEGAGAGPSFEAVERIRMLVERIEPEALKADAGVDRALLDEVMRAHQPDERPVLSRLASWVARKIDALQSARPGKGKKPARRLSGEQISRLARHRPAGDRATVTREDLSVLIGLWQYAKGQDPTGWVSDPGAIVGKRLGRGDKQ